MTRYILLILGVSFFTMLSCGKEERQSKLSIVGVWKDGGESGSSTGFWVIQSCDSNDTHEFFDNGRYSYSTGTETCGFQVNKEGTFIVKNDSVLIYTINPALWYIQKLTASELIFAHRLSFGTGFLWGYHRLIR